MSMRLQSPSPQREKQSVARTQKKQQCSPATGTLVRPPHAPLLVADRESLIERARYLTALLAAKRDPGSTLIPPPPGRPRLVVAYTHDGEQPPLLSAQEFSADITQEVPVIQYAYRIPGYAIPRGPVSAESLDGVKAKIRKALGVTRLPRGVEIWNTEDRPLPRWRLAEAF